ncbi:putative membrane protein YphA (DoxX/SURF4 family) [Chryseobacterium defluvii]|uniref:Putative membrane protein YphA (DoxX/SURF4 family) n=1 Tax=Chryseobacterium defluvii TaxID=160396 RepID=A0A840KFK3_9FLAO|nr:hypothetical protein [Chryseobacterium defluvii]MBB4808141.1 putative membrane protein YphA (DoxX/SURF4 family) [Chryseobacterium defluvii]
MMTAKEKFSYLIYWIIIFTVSGSMIVYGVGKPVQFQDFKSSVNTNLSEGHQLMWTFYSYTKAYPVIIGIFEITGGVFILFNRTRILGCLLLSTILVNIIIQDYLYQISALNTAIFYQILILAILVFDFDKVKIVIGELLKSHRKSRNLILMIVAFILAIVVKYFEAKII